MVWLKVVAVVGRATARKVPASRASDTLPKIPCLPVKRLPVETRPVFSSRGAAIETSTLNPDVPRDAPAGQRETLSPGRARSPPRRSVTAPTRRALHRIHPGRT